MFWLAGVRIYRHLSRDTQNANLTFVSDCCSLEIRTANDPSVFTIMEKAPTRAFSWLQVPNSAFMVKTLLGQCAKWALTHGK